MHERLKMEIIEDILFPFVSVNVLISCCKILILFLKIYFIDEQYFFARAVINGK